MKGNGRFADVKRAVRNGQTCRRALGVVAVDVKRGRMGGPVCGRDASANLLLINQKDGTFRDVGSEAEVAYDANGRGKGRHGC